MVSYQILMKKITENVLVYGKLCIFATAKQERPVIGLWCNGNTTDSGPVIPGSNPGSPTIRHIFKAKEPTKIII